MGFGDIPLRENSKTVDADWWNSLRQAGIELSSFFGAGFIGEKEQAIVNNQASPANVNLLVFNSTLVRVATINFYIYRQTTGGGAVELMEVGKMVAKYLAGGWELSSPESIGDDAGLLFTITVGGQVQYTSSNITGTPAISKMRFNATTMAPGV